VRDVLDNGPTQIGTYEKCTLGGGVNLIEQLESRSGAMKVSELCELLGVDDKHIYRMAARGALPSFHIGGSVRFDPQEVANWLRLKYGTGDEVPQRKPPVHARPHGKQWRQSA
jgi:excisionase family DNA binding protein